jgi:hypothetical protein
MTLLNDHPAALSPARGAADYRRWADDCARQAADPRASGDEREYLLVKRRALIALAAAEDWLNGNMHGRDFAS